MGPGAAPGVSSPLPVALQLWWGGRDAQLEGVNLGVLGIVSELGAGPGCLGSQRGGACWAALPVVWASLVTDGWCLGSGLSWEPRSCAVEQVRLRCTQGSLEWMYPARALRVVLEPSLSSAWHTVVCIKPASDFQGSHIYVERAGQLHLVESEAEGAQLQHVSCFSAHAPQRVALFLQASPQRDISRRTASFQYELLSNQSTAGPDFKKMALVEVVKGSIRNISHNSENHMSQVDVSIQKVYRQKNRIFQQDEASGEWRGPIRTLLQCKVKKGGGDFLFTGNEHFGEAWLGCAPRFKDFMFIYQAARERGANPCEFQLN